jgi:very-short-patch-repair endonuclease
MARKRLADLVKKTARKLRHKQTPAENALWLELRARKLRRLKFLRQHPITFDYFGQKRFIIADFYCAAAKLIIELDGGIHEEQVDYDAARDLLVRSLGLRVLRFKNEEVLGEMEKVLEIIASAIG